MNIEVRAPEASIILTVNETDGTTGDVDLTHNAASLIRWGIENSRSTDEREAATATLGTLSVEDEVIFARDGVVMDTVEALEFMNDGLVNCIRAAVDGWKATMPAESDDCATAVEA